MDVCLQTSGKELNKGKRENCTCQRRKNKSPRQCGARGGGGTYPPPPPWFRYFFNFFFLLVSSAVGHRHDNSPTPAVARHFAPPLRKHPGAAPGPRGLNAHLNLRKLPVVHLGVCHQLERLWGALPLGPHGAMCTIWTILNLPQMMHLEELDETV